MVVFRDGDSAAPMRTMIIGMVLADDLLTLVPEGEPQPMLPGVNPAWAMIVLPIMPEDDLAVAWGLWTEDTFCDPAERWWD